MAKLPQAVQQAAQQAEPSTGGFGKPLPPGVYRAKILECDLSVPQKAPNTGTNAQWVFEVNQDGVPKRKLTHRVSHADTAAGMMHAVFNAAGLSLDSDEAEFIDEFVALELYIKQAEKGKMAGQDVNEIGAVLPLNGAVLAAQAASNGSAVPASARPQNDPWQ